MNAAGAGLFFSSAETRAVRLLSLKCFAWLSLTVNLLDAAGYLAFSGIGGFGDWAMFSPLVGGSAQRYIVARRLCIPPYLAGGIV